MSEPRDGGGGGEGRGRVGGGTKARMVPRAPSSPPAASAPAAAAEAPPAPPPLVSSASAASSSAIVPLVTPSLSRARLEGTSADTPAIVLSHSNSISTAYSGSTNASSNTTHCRCLGSSSRGTTTLWYCNASEWGGGAGRRGATPGEGIRWRSGEQDKGGLKARRTQQEARPGSRRTHKMQEARETKTCKYPSSPKRPRSTHANMQEPGSSEHAAAEDVPACRQTGCRRPLSSSLLRSPACSGSCRGRPWR